MSRLRWVVLILAAVSLGCQQDTVNDSRGESGSTTTQNETQIAVWGDVMVVAWNDIGELGYRTEYAYSTNGGQTWHDAGSLGGSLGERTDGDPAVAVDNTGIFYLATMVTKFNNDSAIGVYRSTQLSPAVRFGNPVLVGGSAPPDLQDRPSIAVDLTTGLGTSGNVYLCWTDIRTSNSTSKLKFIKSTPPAGTGALNFGDPLELNTEGQAPGTACNIGVGPSGEVYVTWIAGVGTDSQKIYVRKSVNGGQYFEPAVEVASPAPSGDWNGPIAPSASFDCSIDRDMRALNGHIRLADAPVIAVDRNASSQYKGTVYIAYSADPDGGAGDDADVFVVRLPSGGATGLPWSAPMAIHKAAALPAAPGSDGPDPTSNDNWMPAIAVSSSGAVAVSSYDRRHDQGNMNIDVYAAISKNGGEEWTNQRVTTSASFGVPPLYPANFNSWTVPCYMGDYNGIAAAGTTFHLVWGDNSKVVRDLNFPNGRPDPDIKYKRLDVP